MLAKKYRLSRRGAGLSPGKEKKNTTTASSAFFSLKRRGPGSGDSRFSVVVPKKIARSAVSRNRIKRMIYAWLEKKRGHIDKGFDFVLILKAGGASLEKEEIEEKLNNLFLIKN